MARRCSNHRVARIAWGRAEAVTAATKLAAGVVAQEEHNVAVLSNRRLFTEAKGAAQGVAKETTKPDPTTSL